MFDVRQIGGDCHVDRMARSVVLLSGRFHAAWIAVFHADAVMRAVDGHARLDLHAVDDGAEIRVAVQLDRKRRHARIQREMQNIIAQLAVEIYGYFKFVAEIPFGAKYAA